MNKFFRPLAFLVAVYCLTWVGVLWWWQRTGHNIEVQDVVLYLGLLPLALLLLLLALRWAWTRAGARSAAALAAVPVGAAAGASASSDDATSAIDAQSRHAMTQLVHVAVCSISGDQVSDLLDAAAVGKPLPQPDADLSDDDGLPVLCARIPGEALPLEAVRAEVEALLPQLQQAQPDWQSLVPSEDVLRALSALREPLLSQQRWLTELDQMRKVTMEDGGESLPRLPPTQRSPAPSLRVLLGHPQHWGLFEQTLARLWVERLMSVAEVDLSKAYDISYAALAGTGEDLWLRADQMCQATTRANWLLVAACHSDLAASRVDALLAAQRLYHSTERPGGCIPGEAAAALLLAPAAWTPPPDLDATIVSLHRPALTRRDKPVEAAGRTGHRDLADAISQALAAAQIDTSAVGMLVCDADQHSPRSPELFGVTVDALSHLDPVEDVRLLGKVTGYTGVVSWLLVLATAAAAAKAKKINTLALGLADSHLRMALVIKPQEEPDAVA